MKFSQKMEKTPVRNAIQVDSMDQALENRLWNVIYMNLFKVDYYDKEASKIIRAFQCQMVWTDFFGERVDFLPQTLDAKTVSFVYEYSNKWFFNSQWYEKYDFIEYLILNAASPELEEQFNSALEREKSGYRIIDGHVVQITSEEEIVAIEDALGIASQWEPVHTHLQTALEFFANRENPDYRNSVKESISAVESFCRIITGKTKLSDALIVIEDKFKIHRSLKSAFDKLYGYTSDSGGIRHALLEDSVPVTMEDARFMLVSCSAFINYLKTKIDNSNTSPS